MVFSGDNHINRGLKLSVPPPLTLRKRRGGHVQSPVASDFIKHTYVMEFPLKPQRRGFGVLPHWCTHEDLWRVQRGHISFMPFPHNLGFACLHPDVPDLYPLIINWSQPLKHLPEFHESFYQSVKSEKGMGWGKFNFLTNSDGSMDPTGTQYLPLISEVSSSPLKSHSYFRQLVSELK